MKRIKIGDKYFIQENDGCLHPEAKEDRAVYDYLTSSYKEDFNRINETKVNHIKRHRNICTEIDTKNRNKSFCVEKMIMSQETLIFLTENEKIRDDVFKKYGLYEVKLIVDNDIKYRYLKIYYDDNRIETIEIGGCYDKKKHYAETLIEEIENSKFKYNKK